MTSLDIAIDEGGSWKQNAQAGRDEVPFYNSPSTIAALTASRCTNINRGYFAMDHRNPITANVKSTKTA